MISDKNEVLIIDNDPGEIDAIREMVSNGGGKNYFDICGSIGLTEGLQQLSSNHFDVILLGLGLEDINGLEALRIVHRKAPKVPIIVLAGLQDEYLGVSALGDGAQDYLVKGKMDGSIIIRAISHAIERKLVEESLILKDRAIESSIECIGFADMCGNLVYANGSLVRNLGYDSAADLVGKNLFDILSGKEKSATILNSLIEKGSWTGEDRAVKKNGSPVDIQISASIVRNDTGEPLCMMASWEDITDRKNAEKELRIRDIAISSSLNAIAIADLNGVLISVNDAFMKMTGAEDQKEIIGKPLSILYPDGFQTSQWMRIIRIKESWSGEFPIKRSGSGRGIWVKGLINLVRDIEKSPLCVIASFIDITDQKKAEEKLIGSEKKYRQLFELANEGIWVIDANDTTSMINPRMAEMLGYSCKEMIGKPIYSFVDGQNAAIVKDYFDDQKRGVKTCRETSFVRRDGSTIYTTISASLILDDKGNFAGILAFVNDISDRKHYEMELQDSIEEACREKSRAQMYFDFMAHDIANIISPILVYSEMICGANNVPPKMKGLCAEIQTQAQRASSLISNLRRLEEVEGMSAEEISGVDLKVAIAAAESSVCREFKSKTFAISHSFPEDEHVIAKGSGIVEDILKKILQNAARYSRNDTVEISIEVIPSRDSSGKTFWRVEIADHGVGISAAQKATLMNTPDPTKSMVRGIYSSLPFCITLARHIGGDVFIGDRIANDPEQGAKISLKVPAGE